MNNMRVQVEYRKEASQKGWWVEATGRPSKWFASHDLQAVLEHVGTLMGHEVSVRVYD